MAQLSQTGVRVHGALCDVGDEAAVEAAFAGTLAALGRVDACFANAGTYGRKMKFTELDSAEWHRVTRLNLDGAFYTLRTAARHMVERGGGGSLVGTASLAAIEGAARNTQYAATKGAMVAVIRALAVELARHGIRANAVLPGWIETPMTARSVGDEKFAAMPGGVPILNAEKKLIGALAIGGISAQEDVEAAELLVAALQNNMPS